MPSVLIELGYITNATEERFLLSEQGTSTLARSIYNAFINYKQDGLKNTANIQPNEQTSVKSDQDTGKPIQTMSRPVFKIQILTSSKVLSKGNKQLKGLSPVSYYREKGLVKYTYGEDTDYNKIRRLKRDKVDHKFADAFIIAFRNGEKIDIKQAIKEFKQNRK